MIKRQRALVEALRTISFTYNNEQATSKPFLHMKRE